MAQQVGDWIEARQRHDELVAAWQSIEHRLSLRARSQGVPLQKAYKKAWPEVKAMTALTLSIQTLERNLRKTARSILRRPVGTTDDALAKLCLGLNVREPSDGDALAWSLVEASYRHLTAEHAARDDRRELPGFEDV